MSAEQQVNISADGRRAAAQHDTGLYLHATGLLSALKRGRAEGDRASDNIIRSPESPSLLIKLRQSSLSARRRKVNRREEREDARVTNNIALMRRDAGLVVVVVEEVGVVGFFLILK